MSVISISIKDVMLKELDVIQKELGYSGRSEVIRAAARMLIDDYRHKKPMQGPMSAVIITVHKKQDDVIAKVKHSYESIITTQIHNHTVENSCLDIFILKGDATRIQEMNIMLHSCNKMDYLSLVTL